MKNDRQVIARHSIYDEHDSLKEKIETWLKNANGLLIIKDNIYIKGGIVSQGEGQSVEIIKPFIYNTKTNNSFIMHQKS